MTQGVKAMLAAFAAVAVFAIIGGLAYDAYEGTEMSKCVDQNAEYLNKGQYYLVDPCPSYSGVGATLAGFGALVLVVVVVVVIVMKVTNKRPPAAQLPPTPPAQSA
ncbi:hypothetical protein FK530_09680 [Tsukamurella conjunctivitidis]|uniref:Uncharacterized protein n=1 Tax=Tsukamurella conjunctivitidis TaxID=2592068 RepID=A0A5C5S0X6_9ACTN|nr:hypothetical protein [Tsukamurella conjunctivitidis]TWS29076.1 hypothetical protein FK530_09680 [Tsukamurella conjunctivitidis]